MIKALEITVRGKVQGVYYRASTQKKALEIGLVGYVMNMPDGTVFLIAQGEESALNHLKEWCQKGPVMAKILSITSKEVEVSELRNFYIKR